MQLNNTTADKISKNMYIVLLKILFYHNICIWYRVTIIHLYEIKCKLFKNY